MRIFYKNGFYFEGINNNIPSDAVEISETIHKKLLNDMSQGMILKEDENGYPYSCVNDEQIYQTNKLAIETDFNNIINNPVKYTNNCYYRPKYIDEYVKLLLKYFDDEMTYDIWDATGKVENMRKMNKQELTDLIKFLLKIYEQEYQNKKIKLSNL